jgi:hypothetical protein
MPLPQTLLIVSAGTVFGIPEKIEAWRAGAWDLGCVWCLEILF